MQVLSIQEYIQFSLHSQSGGRRHHVVREPAEVDTRRAWRTSSTTWLFQIIPKTLEMTQNGMTCVDKVQEQHDQ